MLKAATMTGPRPSVRLHDKPDSRKQQIELLFIPSDLIDR